MKPFKRFCSEQDGAVTVDWVVLAAAIITLAVVLTAAMQDGALGLADALSSYMSNWTF